MDKTKIVITETPSAEYSSYREELRLHIMSLGLHEDQEDDDNLIYRSKAKAIKALTEARKSLIKAKLWNNDADICHHLKGSHIAYYNAIAKMEGVLSN